ncbi:MAG TPA: response regulator [Desulfobacteraceae bacterium]|nr:response regulator [Desulfobacteraceae bacterium]
MSASNTPHILIVDDNPFNRELISEVALAEGFAVKEAQNGHQALDMVKQTDFALVMMDLLMPGMDGFETTRKIREMGKDLPIVAVSALAMKQDRQESLRSGCNDFLSKPLDLQQLKTVILKYTQKKASTFENGMQNGDDDSLLLSLPGFEGLFLLLVEEDGPRRKEKSDFLARAGFQVKAVANGADAIEFIEKSSDNVQVVISNIFTTGIDGLGLLTIVKRKFPRILVFLYTESYDPSTFQYAVQQKVDGMIPRDQFETAALDIIRSALYQSGQKGSRTSEARVAQQVRKAQERLIHPGCMNICPSLDVAYQSLSEAGGDMMQCRRFGAEGTCGILLADVAGHSVMSSYTSAIFTGLLMSVWDLHRDPVDLLKKMDRELFKIGNDKSHICATALLWDRWSGKFSFGCAGNPGGLMVTFAADGRPEFERLPGGGMVLGVLENHDLFHFGTGTLKPHAYLFLFSDGIHASQLIRAIENSPQRLDRRGIAGICRQLMDTMLDTSEPEDDMILLCMHNAALSGKPDFISSYPASYEGVDRACSWMNSHLTESAIPAGNDRDFVLLSAREVLLNAVEHGSGRNFSARFETLLYVKEDELKITVIDEGKGFDLKKNLSPPKELTLEQIGKRGLSFAWSIAHEIVAEKGSITLIFKAKPIQEEK